ncbi:hypothetical protein [Bacillus litorisediminis]|uniref:hypothetical protein n=1 Tax=Bacillus litorisediminis TaxID=2922713 RepID=UPI001FACF541|nr:hypothetical protein [Bacillus litorisediminis]
MKKLLTLAGEIIATLALLMGILNQSSTVHASPIDCGIKMPPEYIASYSSDEISIMCGAAAQTRWNEIKATATPSPKQGTTVNSYDKTGGSTAALRDFNSMPGTAQTRDGGVLIKQYSDTGTTLTYYPKSTTTSTPTLQFPASDGIKVWDKIRYYE